MKQLRGMYELVHISGSYFANKKLSADSSLLILTNYTGRFMMFSMITNIYNKKTKGPTLMEFFNVCHVTRGVNIEHLQLSKKTFSVSLWL
jgi:hypothetical protein